MARTRQPRRHLFSVIRQKVSPPKNKHNERGTRSQGGGATPLANLHRFLACPLRKFGLATCSAKLLHPTLGRDLPLASRRQRGTQRAPTSCVAPPGVAEARATHWVAISQLATKKLLRPTNFVRAPWEIIPDKLTVYRFDFLLRRGARCCSALEPGLPTAISIVRALAEIDQTTLGCLVDFLLQQSRAGAARHSKSGFFSAKLRWRRPEKRLCPTVIVRAPWEIIPDKLIVYRVDFLLRRGARTHRVFYRPAGCKLLRLPYAGSGPYAGRAVPPGTRYWPAGREKQPKPHHWGLPEKKPHAGRPRTPNNHGPPSLHPHKKGFRETRFPKAFQTQSPPATPSSQHPLRRPVTVFVLLTTTARTRIVPSDPFFGLCRHGFPRRRSRPRSGRHPRRHRPIIP